VIPKPPTPDLLGRPLADLRISVTDRCNFRCPYCMPRSRFGSGHAFLPRAELLTYEEIDRLAGLFAGLGVRKFRLTGGEPLLRRDLPVLVTLLARHRDTDLALTTNGARLAEMAAPLAAAGLRRVTVSLDALDEEIFRRMSDSDVPVATVLAGITAARATGLAPVKVNTVVRRGWNESEILPLAARFRGGDCELRFIEFMDVGTTNGWRRDEVVPAREILDRIDARWPIEPVEPGYRGEVATRWRYRDGGGEIGVIGSVTAPFCGDCTRARLSAEGRLYTCLFAAVGSDLRGPLRAGESDAELATRIARLWGARSDRYSEIRSGVRGAGRIEMSYIGG